MLTKTERALINAIRKNPYATQQEFAEEIGLSRSATANLLAKLQREGHILGKPYILSEHNLITCIGGANVDRKLMLFKRAEMGTSNPVRPSFSCGGVARNVGENLSRLGLSVSLMTLVGKDTDGERLLADAAATMQIFASERLDGEATGSYTAVLDPEKELLIGLASMEICKRMDKEWILRHRGHLLAGPSLLCDCNVGADALETVIGLARENGRQFILVGVSAPKTDKIPQDLTGVSLGIFNVDESQAYFDTRERDVRKLAGLWLSAGAERIVVTDGVRGFSYGSMAEGVKTCHVHKEKYAVDVTGAGDAFTAGVVYGLRQKMPLNEAVQYGAANAALTVSSLDSVRKDLSEALLSKKVSQIAAEQIKNELIH